MEKFVELVRDHFETTDFVPLHAPSFTGQEIDFVKEAIESTFVSSVGEFVNRFEYEIAEFCAAEKAVAVVNGTAALQVALQVAGVKPGELVITQALTFVATANAISFCQASPIFVDVERQTLGLCPKALENWLVENCTRDDTGACIHKESKKIVRACLPMHTFGHPCNTVAILAVCEAWGLVLVEDSAEALGSYRDGKHVGQSGPVSAISFNGNKIITAGGGGAIIGDGDLCARAKHLTTTAKLPHAYEYIHDEIGYNYRMPNLNAALVSAQLQKLPDFIKSKRGLAMIYRDFFKYTEFEFVDEPFGCQSNFWLNAIICESKTQRDKLLEFTNQNKVMTRPAWQLLTDLSIYQNSYRDGLDVSRWLQDRLVNLPSSPRLTRI